MLELVSVLAVAAAIVAVSIGWRRFARVDEWQEGDARSTITPEPDGTIRVVVTNPGPQAVVVTACARPVKRLRWWGRDLVCRGPKQRERHNSWRAFRQLLGSVPAGGQSTWTVVGDADARPLCRVMLSIYQTAGRVRVHEAVVHTEPTVAGRVGWLDLLPRVPAGH